MIIINKEIKLPDETPAKVTFNMEINDILAIANIGAGLKEPYLGTDFKPSGGISLVRGNYVFEVNNANVMVRKNSVTLILDTTINNERTTLDINLS